jgi:porin
MLKNLGIAFVVGISLLPITGCGGDGQEETGPVVETRGPEVTLAWNTVRQHEPGRGTLRATARDADGDLRAVVLVGTRLDFVTVVSGHVNTVTATLVDLEAGVHVCIARVIDHEGRISDDTLFVEISENRPPPDTLIARGVNNEWRLVQRDTADPEGDPVAYTLAVDGPVSLRIGPRDTPVDTTFSLPQGNYRITSITADGIAADTTTHDITVTGRPPTATQWVQRAGVTLHYRSHVDAAYATLTAVKAPRDVFYHGPVPSDTVFSGLAEDDSTGLPKGDYFFRLYARRQGLTHDQTVWASIIDLPPVVDLDGVDLSLDQGDTITVTLPAPYDPNPEDSPAYSRATSLDGKVSATLAENDLTISAAADSSGLFRLELAAGDATTGESVDTLEATIYEHVTLGDSTGSKSGYGDIPVDGGATSVNADLVTDDDTKNPIFDVDYSSRIFSRYYKLKRTLKDRYGFSFGVDYSFLNQYSNYSTTDRQAASGVFRMFGSWKLFGKWVDGATFEYRVENRHLIGKGVTPRNLGFDGGSSLSTATFKDFGWGVTILNIKQRLYDGRIVLLAGKMDPGDYSDVYALLTAYKSLMNDAYFNNPTVSLPQHGFGVVGKVVPVEQWYVMAGLHDANGLPTEVGVDDFFRVREYYTWIEAGWEPRDTRVAGLGAHVNVWRQDPRAEEGTEEAWGITVSANQQFGQRWIPFFRAGYSEGNGGQLVGEMVGVGFGARVRTSDFLGVATSWSTPLDNSLRDQVTSEIIYRVQLTEHVVVSPGIQFTVNPSHTLDTDFLSVASAFRIRISL